MKPVRAHCFSVNYLYVHIFSHGSEKHLGISSLVLKPTLIAISVQSFPILALKSPATKKLVEGNLSSSRSVLSNCSSIGPR